MPEPAEKSTFGEANVRGPKRRIWLFAAGGILALLVAALLLDFFGVLPLASSIKQLPGLFIPHAKIVASSSLPKYSLKLTDEKLLEGYLKDWGFWQGIRWNGRQVVPKRLIIRLTDSPGPVLSISYSDRPDTVVQASDETFGEISQELTILPYLHLDYLPGGSKDDGRRANQTLNLLVLRHLWGVTHPARNFNDLKAAEEAWSPVQKQFRDKNKMFLEVSSR